MLTCLETRKPQEDVWDTALSVPGLIFGVRLTGARNRKTFCCVYKVKGQNRRMKLGVYPYMTLEEARREALRIAIQVMDGHDPARDKRDRLKGMIGGKVYRAWKGMKNRCLDKNHDSYRNYGGRGIEVHPHFMMFDNFYREIGDPPTPEHTLDRIDTNGDYEPGNIRWATRKEQQANRRR